MLRRRSYIPKQYLVLKLEGLEFVKTWFDKRESIPSSSTRLYQLLLHLITMNGVIPIQLAFRFGYTKKLVGEAIAMGYAILSPTPQKPLDEVLIQIKDIIGKPPQQMFG